VGYGGEASIARRALDALTLAKRSPDKVKQARARINERSDQLYWAEIVERELSIIDVYSPDQGLLYITAQADSASVWATYSNENGSWSFSFDLTTLQHDLAAMVARLNELEPDLAVQLMLPGVSAPDTSMIARPLPAPLGSIQVSVQPADPEGLERVRQSAAQTRRIVILVSVFMVLMGVVFSARIVSREVENARVKADFAANVSHELRSPITQIRLKGEALQYGLVDPGQDMQDHFDAIVREAERLSRLVDNVLDFAAIERGAKRYHLRQDDLIAVVWNTAEAMRATIEGQGLTLELDVPDDLRPIWIDREAIAQVLINLMSNAAKYGASGGWVGISIRQSHTGVDVSVSDRGIGISAEDSNQIFEHFYRSTDPNVRKKKGTGIGLTIVRYIVEAHGGTIAVDSAPNRGSTFTITFPFDPPTGHGA
jgi:signal transduction histidine kinase